MEIRNKAQIIVMKAFEPGEWDILCFEPEFQRLFDQTTNTQQAEEAIIRGVQILQAHQDRIQANQLVLGPQRSRFC